MPKMIELVEPALVRGRTMTIFNHIIPSVYCSQDPTFASMWEVGSYQEPTPDSYQDGIPSL